MTLVLLTEHLSFEINSFVFSAQKATAGALLFFIKTGLWALLAVGGMMSGVGVRHRQRVVVVGGRQRAGDHRRLLDRGERAQGAGGRYVATASVWKAGLPFYLGTGLIALSQYAERFLIMDLEPYASLGKYVYAWSAANTLQALSYAVVAVVGIPVLAKRYQG